MGLAKSELSTRDGQRAGTPKATATATANAETQRTRRKRGKLLLRTGTMAPSKVGSPASTAGFYPPGFSLRSLRSSASLRGQLRR